MTKLYSFMAIVLYFAAFGHFATFTAIPGICHPNNIDHGPHIAMPWSIVINKDFSADHGKQADIMAKILYVR